MLSMRVTFLQALAVLLFVLLPGAVTAQAGFGGVGIDGAPWANGQIVVRQLVAGGPAAQAGIRVGDIITHIDGKPTAGSDFRTVVERRLRGKPGTTVVLKVHHPGEKGVQTFTLVRRELVPPAK